MRGNYKLFKNNCYYTAKVAYELDDNEYFKDYDPKYYT